MFRIALTSVISIIITTIGVIGYIEARMITIVETKSPYVQDRRYIDETLKEVKEEVKNLSIAIAKNNEALNRLNGYLDALEKSKR